MRQISMQGRHHDKGQIKEELISTYETITMPNARSRGPVLDGLERGQACQLLHPRPQPLRCCLQHRLDSSHSIYWQLLGRRSSLSFGDNFHPECPDCLARQLLGQNLQSCGHEEIWWVFFSGWFLLTPTRALYVTMLFCFHETLSIPFIKSFPLNLKISHDCLRSRIPKALLFNRLLQCWKCA